MPAELLNLVFWYLWSIYPVIWTTTADMHIVLYFPGATLKHPVPHRGLPKWLLVCKMFLYQGRAV
jgi:hypothetical protein